MAIHNTAVSSAPDGTLAINSGPDSNEESFESSTLYIDNRTAIMNGSMVGSDLLFCEAKHIGSSASIPTVQWIRNGEMISTTVGFMSILEITSFTVANTGVYQCVFIDNDMDAEVITTIPFRLDTGRFYSAYYYNKLYTYCRHIWNC